MQNFYSNKLLKHGLFAMLLGLFGGFLLAFSMLGAIGVSPIPFSIEVDFPGTSRGWRILHVGTLMNGMMAALIAIAMKHFFLSDRQARWIFLGIAIAIWGNFCFYLFGMFAPNHGLSIGANRLGEASLAGAFAYLPAMLAAVTAIVALIILLRSESR